MDWIELSESEQVKNIKNESITHPDKSYVLFKHSTRCSTSRMALRMFESGWINQPPAYLINVVENRPASNEAANLYHITHESPQILVIRNGVCIYDASHSDIDPERVISIL